MWFINIFGTEWKKKQKIDHIISYMYMNYISGKSIDVSKECLIYRKFVDSDRNVYEEIVSFNAELSLVWSRR